MQPPGGDLNRGGEPDSENEEVQPSRGRKRPLQHGVLRAQDLTYMLDVPPPPELTGQYSRPVSQNFVVYPKEEKDDYIKMVRAQTENYREKRLNDRQKGAKASHNFAALSPHERETVQALSAGDAQAIIHQHVHFGQPSLHRVIRRMHTTSLAGPMVPKVPEISIPKTTEEHHRRQYLDRHGFENEDHYVASLTHRERLERKKDFFLKEVRKMRIEQDGRWVDFTPTVGERFNLEGEEVERMIPLFSSKVQEFFRHIVTQPPRFRQLSMEQSTVLQYHHKLTMMTNVASMSLILDLMAAHAATIPPSAPKELLDAQEARLIKFKEILHLLSLVAGSQTAAWFKGADSEKNRAPMSKILREIEEMNEEYKFEKRVYGIEKKVARYQGTEISISKQLADTLKGGKKAKNNGSNSAPNLKHRS